MKHLDLSVNVDHVATLRNARGGVHPCPVEASRIAVEAGADGITVHLREDRRHIKDRDVERIRAEIAAPMNFEMAATEEMVAFAERIRPPYCCIVPEKRAELTMDRFYAKRWRGCVRPMCAFPSSSKPMRRRLKPRRRLARLRLNCTLAPMPKGRWPTGQRNLCACKRVLRRRGARACSAMPGMG